jgi:putative phosphoribosyl transferase
MSQEAYRNRIDAGARLAEALAGRGWPPSTLVIALPRGGVPVAAAVAARLKLALDILIVRKLGLPDQPEVAMGAVASGNVVMANDWILASLPNPKEVFDQVLARECAEMDRRERLYRSGRPALEVRDRGVIVVDDGLATGATMRAALEALRQRGAGRQTVAVPVAAMEARDALARVADEVVCPLVPHDFGGVGQFYEDFSQTSDREVQQLLTEMDTVS